MIIIHLVVRRGRKTRAVCVSIFIILPLEPIVTFPSTKTISVIIFHYKANSRTGVLDAAVKNKLTLDISQKKHTNPQQQEENKVKGEHEFILNIRSTYVNTLSSLSQKNKLWFYIKKKQISFGWVGRIWSWHKFWLLSFTVAADRARSRWY